MFMFCVCMSVCGLMCLCFDCVGLRVVAGCVVVRLLGFVCVRFWVCVGFKVSVFCS